MVHVRKAGAAREDCKAEEEQSGPYGCRFEAFGILPKSKGEDVAAEAYENHGKEESHDSWLRDLSRTSRNQTGNTMDPERMLR